MRDPRYARAALLVALALWLVTTARTTIPAFGPDPFYLYRALPATYWIGLLVCVGVVVLWSARPETPPGKDQALLVALFVLYLFGTVTFAYPTARFSDSYGVAQDVEALAASGRVEFTGALLYKNAIPGALAATVGAMGATGVAAVEVARWFPLVLMASLAALTSVAARQAAPARWHLAGAAAVCLAFVAEYHFSPQAYTLILFATFWCLVLLLAARRVLSAFALVALALLVFAAIVTTHAGTPLFVVVGLLALGILWRLREGRARTGGPPFLALAAYSAAVWLGWLAVVARGHFDYLTILIVQAVRTLGVRVPRSSSAFLEEDVLPLTAQLHDGSRIALALAILGLGALLALASLRSRSSTRFFAGTLFLATAASFAPLAGHGMIGRILIFTPWAIAVLMACVLQERPREGSRVPRVLAPAGVALVVVATLLFPLSHYGGDYVEHVTTGALVGADWWTQNGPPFKDVHPPIAGFSNGLTEPLGPLVTVTDGDYNLVEARTDRGEEFMRWAFPPERALVYDNGRYWVGLRV